MTPFNIHSHSFSSHECNICHSIGPFVLSLSFITTPPIIFLDLSNYTTTPPLDWTIPSSGISSAIQYHLFACLYVGSHHFTSCYIDESNICWTYDGQLHSSHLFPEGPAHNQDLTCLGTWTLCSVGYICHPLLMWIYLVFCFILNLHFWASHHFLLFIKFCVAFCCTAIVFGSGSSRHLYSEHDRLILYHTMLMLHCLSHQSIE